MEAKNTNGLRGQLNTVESDDYTAIRRLHILLALNSEIAKQKAMFRSAAERLDASLMRHPLAFEKTFAYFGLLLGTFPPATFFLSFVISSRVNGLHPAIPILLLFVNLVTAVTGYFSGRIVGTIVGKFEKSSRSRIALIMPLIGFAWGAVCGWIGGIFIFVIGAFFGAFLGGAVGAVALPVFVGFHRWLKRGDFMDRRHFLPVAFGVTFTISSFILGRLFS